MIDILDEMKRLVRALEAGNAEYALCGGLAVAVHGAPRYTADIDLLLDHASISNAVAITKQCGFIFAATPMQFSDGVEVHRLTKIVGTEMLTVDLMVVSPMYQAVWDGRIRLEIGDTPLVVVSREGLIQMKVAAGRQKDLMDVAKLTDLDR